MDLKAETKKEFEKILERFKQCVAGMPHDEVLFVLSEIAFLRAQQNATLEILKNFEKETAGPS